MKRIAAIATAALLGAAVCVQAGTLADLPPGCDRNTYEIVQCQIRELAKLNERLETAYRAALEASEAAQRDALAEAQALWLKFRAADCDYYGKASGTIASVRGGYCMLDLTRTRAEELEEAVRP